MSCCNALEHLESFGIKVKGSCPQVLWGETEPSKILEDEFQGLFFPSFCAASLLWTL